MDQILSVTIQMKSHNLTRGTVYYALRGGVNLRYINEILVGLFKYDLHFFCFLSPLEMFITLSKVFLGFIYFSLEIQINLALVVMQYLMYVKRC